MTLRVDALTLEVKDLTAIIAEIKQREEVNKGEGEKTLKEKEEELLTVKAELSVCKQILIFRRERKRENERKRE
jgi:hypothetical protein